MRMEPVVWALRNLNQEFSHGDRYWMARRRAWEMLVKELGVDLGRDPVAWREALVEAGYSIGDAGTPEARLRGA